MLSAGVAMLEFLFPCLRKTRPQSRPRSSTTSRSSQQSAFSDRSTLEEVDAVSIRHNRSFSVEDLKAATQNFHCENLLGTGGFGSVYKGILDDGTLIAVKKLSVRSKQGTNEFINEVKLLSTIQHRNLVRLLGCCTEDDERILVYEYLRNKSLDLALFESDLEWSVRRTIVLGAAKALAYLHEGSRCRIIHRDIKASNILLDDKFQAKIADFGLAKLFDMEQTHASTKVAGSFGYLAPEYVVNGKLTDKADVYSFGMVILEVVSGRRITDFRLPDKEQRLVEVAWRLYNRDSLMELVDGKLGDRYVPWEAARLIQVALLCTQANPDLRPAMSRVVYLLNGRSPISDQPTKPPLIREESPKKQRRQKGYEGLSSGTSGSSTVGSSSSFFSQ